MPNTHVSISSESERLKALKRYEILDTPAEPAFENLAELASIACETPIGLISFVDQDRVWYKARHGWNPTQTARAESAAQFAILKPDITIIADLAADFRFRDNDQVADGAKLRFWAAAPVTTRDGHRIGTVTVAGFEPRTLDDQQIRLMKFLADQVMIQLEARREASATSAYDNAQRAGSSSSGLSRHDVDNIFSAALGSLQLIAQRSLPAERTEQLIHNALTSVMDLRAAVNRALGGLASDAGLDGFVKQSQRHKGHPAIDDNLGHDNLFFAAIEMTRMPMIVTDPNISDNPIVFANQAFLNTTGYAMEEVVGRNCRFLQGEGTDPEAVAAIRRAVEQKTDLAVEMQNYRKDGTMFWNALFISPIFDRDGNALYFFGSQLDITRRREAETALRRAQKMEAIGQLTGGIAHDFNNLLQIVIGNLQLARMASERPEKLGMHLTLAMEGADKAKNLTAQLLAFSRKTVLETRVVNLNRVLTELRDLLSKTLGSHIQFELNLAPNLANAEIDIIQLETAVINILANARDAMESGGTVVVTTRNLALDQMRSGRFGDLAPGHYVELAIKDTGTGMSADVLSKVTEPFFTTKPVGKGTGLGLPQVFGFVKQSEGALTIESGEGQGTTITMTFLASQSIVETAKPKPSLIAEPAGNGEKILVVEDNQQVRELACAILESEGYQIYAAENARSALEKLEGEAADANLLFTDVIMPGAMNGVGLAKEVRKSRPGLPVLVTTGFAEDTHGHTNAAEFEMIYKPYMPEDLTKKIRAVLNRRLDHRS